MNIVAELVLIGLATGSTIALNAIAVSVMYCAVRTLNLAQGDVYALSSVVVMVVLREMLPFDADVPLVEKIVPLVVALAAAVALAVGLNVAIEFLAFRPFRGRSRLAPIIATLGISFILYQVALVWRKLLPTFDRWDHRSVPGVAELPRDIVPHIFPQLNVFAALGAGDALTFDIKDAFTLVVAVLMAVLVHQLLRRTQIGKAIRACAQNSLAAQMLGINLSGTVRGAFAIAGVLAGVAAFVFAITVERPVANHGAQSGLIAFTAAILGGIGNPIGALVSGLVLGVFSSFSDYVLDGRWTPALLNALLVLLLVLRPSGIVAEERDDDATQAQGDSLVAGALRPGASSKPRAVALAILPLVLLYPVLVPLIGEYFLPIINMAMIWVMLALGLTILLGFAGVLDIGYALNFAIGAYLAAFLTGPAIAIRDQLLGYPLDGIAVMIIVAIVTGLIGVAKGAITSRMRADYLAIATMALSLMMRDVLRNSGLGGVDGFAAIPPPRLFGVNVASHDAQYVLMLGIVGLLVLGCFRLLNSRVGRAMAALRDDELAAKSSGVNVAKYKIMAFFMGDAVAGLAGVMYAMLLSYVAPGLADFWVSVMVLAMVAIGGVGSISGAVLGVLVLVGLDRLAIPAIQTLWSDEYAEIDFRQLSFLLFGLALYLSVLGSRGNVWRDASQRLTDTCRRMRESARLRTSS